MLRFSCRRFEESVAILVVGLLLGVVGCVGCAQIAGLKKPTDDNAPKAPDGYDDSVPAGRAEDISIDPPAMDLGAVRCGQELTQPKAITITNDGPVAIKYDVRVPEASQLKVLGTPKGSIPPHSKTTVPITLIPSVAGAIDGEIRVTAGQAFQQVNVKAIGRGGALDITPNITNFGEVRDQSGGAPMPILIMNTGNEDVVIGSFAGAANALDLEWDGKPQGLHVPANGVATLRATFGSGPPQADYVEAQFMPVITGALCSPVSPVVTRGKRIETNVTLTPVDFGKQSCNAPVQGTRDVTITNFAPSAIMYSVTPLASTSAFVIVNEGPKVIAANGTAKITVGVKSVGAIPQLLTEDLLVNVSGISAGTRAVKMQLDVRGAVISLTPAKIDSYYSNGYNTDYRSFDIKNTGNESIGLSFGFNRLQGGDDDAWVREKEGDVKAAGATKLTIGFRPDGDGWHQAEFPIAQRNGAVLCNKPEIPTGRGYRPDW